nr:hypothetical protein [Streptomyces sp. NWU339]
MKHATPQVGSPTGTFTQLLSSTRRGARLARLLAMTELRSWSAPPDLTERAELVVAEPAANAATPVCHRVRTSRFASEFGGIRNQHASGDHTRPSTGLFPWRIGDS